MCYRVPHICQLDRRREILHKDKCQKDAGCRINGSTYLQQFCRHCHLSVQEYAEEQNNT
jgi:hypothetical protein